MKKLALKLKSGRGESLVETLAAILILALSSAMLALMCNAALKINRDAAIANAALYREISLAEQGAGTAKRTIRVYYYGDTGKKEATAYFTNVLFTGAAGELSSFSLPEKED